MTLALPLGTAALAQTDLNATGDAAAGERTFRQRQSCHVVRGPSGEVLAGRVARTGPNLQGVSGAVEDDGYSALMEQVGEGGLVCDEANFVPNLLNPTAHLRAVAGEASGRCKIAYRAPNEKDTADPCAFLAQISG